VGANISIFYQDKERLDWRESNGQRNRHNCS